MRLSVVGFPTVEADTVPDDLGRWTLAGSVAKSSTASLGLVDVVFTIVVVPCS